MPSDAPLVSYAQNREDVVLWRALGHVPAGRYVDVGANHPRDLSVTRAFYERGWSGLTIEPLEEFVALHRQERPRDTVVRAAVVAEPVEHVTIHAFPGTGLSTLDDAVSEDHERDGRRPREVEVPATTLAAAIEEHGWGGAPTHLLVVDVEGLEGEVLRSVDLSTWRPWVVVVEATAPLSNRPTHEAWEPRLLAAGYEFCLFDGVSRFYVAAEHAATLMPALNYPACALDSFVDASLRDVQEQLAAAIDALAMLEESRAALLNDLVRWRTQAITSWDAMVSDDWAPATLHELRREFDHVRAELEATRRTVSWRVTAPLRVARRWGRRR